jgi:hypothetical protein
MNLKAWFCTLNLSNNDALPDDDRGTCQTRRRLVEAFSRLQNIQLVRAHRQDRYFGKSAEERIIWRELIDLELQEADEQMERILASAGAKLEH